MHRLPLLLCALALLGSAVSGLLFFEIGNTKQVLESRLADAQVRTTRLETELATANRRNGELAHQVRGLEADVARVTFQLKDAVNRAEGAERTVGQLRTDLGQTRAVLEVYDATARGLAEDLGKLRVELEETRSTHASPEVIATYRSTIADLERQLASAQSGTAAPGAPAASTAVFTNRAGRATILSVGPENAFVVLNFGSARGARLGQRLAVSHGVNEVATLQISDVRTNFSIAQVLPNTTRAVLQKGDSAVLVRSSP